jgi:voltage-gated potassium channel
MVDRQTQETDIIDNESQENSTYEVFILALAYLSLLGAIVFYFLSFSDRRSVLVFDTVFCAIFFFDFLRSLYRAPSKQAYLKWGWLDLVGSIPGIPLLRLARIHRIIRGTRILRSMGYRGVLRSFLSRRAESTLLSTLLGTLLILGLVTILVVIIERQSPEANIVTVEDALWWAYVTVTTVGYGDLYPVTSTGRLLASILMLAGVGLFSVITSYLASTFLNPESKRQDTDIELIKAELAEIKQLLKERESGSN